MDRRTVVRTVGTAGVSAVASLAGCLTRNGDDEPPNGPEDGDPEPDEPAYDGTLRIATYRSMVTGPNPAGPWLEEAFLETYPDADLEWVVPERGVEHYVRRGEYGAEIDVDVLLGFTVGDLARIDDSPGEGALLRELNLDRIDRSERLRDELEWGDPHNRALAYDTGYVSLVYDETVVDAPETFDDLLEPASAETLLVQHPTHSMPGQAFLLWTIDAMGVENALEYWEELVANGVEIRDSWSDAYYNAYLDEHRPMVVSYSTDPVFAAVEERDPERHQVAFLNEQGYAVPEGMGIFDATMESDLAYAFLEFLLSDAVQPELARRNVQFPAVDDVGPRPLFEEAAREPPASVATSYTELRGQIDEWLTGWTDRFEAERTDAT
ncbi:thiamine ABC transporter substrate-binding protein [Natronorubrum bangense]|uniref:ABC transporter substrate-binding protein n=2 Tax=Natronorubrum bangense TaxID=61858 RepID=L9WPS6_9EURY|nr:thiamine ABC transporter substrate-binding protein [Natronorubrum bangense]ELY50348.1 ABC transporter substrate-binding protein [Natronorubrum bangense JCM 10635]QCC54215.1 thiamine ABC transporter substrate-binding protein [Natronorubrum bangense]